MTTDFLIPTFAERAPADRYVAALSVDQMKGLWDDWERWGRRDAHYHLLEAIHAEMNRRGEGRYVAV